jgi:hypothetical protein
VASLCLYRYRPGPPHFTEKNETWFLPGSPIPCDHQWLSPPSSLFLPTTRHIIISRLAQHACEYTRCREEAANSAISKNNRVRSCQTHFTIYLTEPEQKNRMSMARRSCCDMNVFFHSTVRMPLPPKKKTLLRRTSHRLLSRLAARCRPLPNSPAGRCFRRVFSQRNTPFANGDAQTQTKQHRSCCI